MLIGGTTFTHHSTCLSRRHCTPPAFPLHSRDITSRKKRSASSGSRVRIYGGETAENSSGCGSRWEQKWKKGGNHGALRVASS